MPERTEAHGSPESSSGDRVPPLVRSILEGTAPRAVKLAAARGALPIPRSDLFRLLVALAEDGDEEIRSEALTCIQSWSEDEMQVLASDLATDPEVLAYLLTRPETESTLLATVLSNLATPLEALLAAARSSGADRLDTLLLNQTLLIQYPRLLEEVEANPAATPLHRARVDEIRRHFFQPAAAPRAEAPPSGPHAGTVAEAPPKQEGRASAAEPERHPPTAPPHGKPAAEPSLAAAGPDTLRPGGPESAEAETPIPEGTLQRIFKMNVGEKIQLASKGTREERTILIRDTNRSVQDAVLNSPKITENEIDSIARMRNVNDDILRQIAGHRDWLKAYSVMQGLATNPKTPLGIAMNLLPRLTTQDLKLLQNDKNVSDNIRRLARKQVEARVNKPGSSRRGGH